MENWPRIRVVEEVAAAYAEGRVVVPVWCCAQQKCRQLERTNSPRPKDRGFAVAFIDDNDTKTFPNAGQQYCAICRPVKVWTECFLPDIAKRLVSAIEDGPIGFRFGRVLHHPV